MRILCLDGPYFLSAFRALGHHTLSIGTSPGLDVRLDRPLSLRRLLDLLDSRQFIPDAVLWADTCQPPSAAGLESLPWPVVGYSIDQYLNPWHVAYSAGFDLFFVAQKDYLPLFAAEHPRQAVWMPLFCDPEHDRDPGLVRDVPMSFVGTLAGPANPGRRAFLNEVKRLAPLVATSGAYGPLFARSRIVLNQSAAGELNFRLFQAMACGAAVLTEDTGNGLAELFTPEQHLLTYRWGDPAHAAAVAKAWLDDPRLGDIAAEGRRLVVSNHTVQVRAALLAGYMRVLIESRGHHPRLTDGPAMRARMANAYTMLATDEVLPLPPELREFYIDLASKTKGT